jgi:hypothetical protein
MPQEVLESNKTVEAVQHGVITTNHNTYDSMKLGSDG